MEDKKPSDDFSLIDNENNVLHNDVNFRSSYCTEENSLNEEYVGHLAAIVESSEDAIISKSLNGVIKSWNRSSERMFGYSSKEVLGKNISLIIPSEYISEEMDILDRVSHNEFIEHFETVRIKKNGERFYVSLTVSPLKDRSGNIMGISKIARDITSRKKFESDIIKANEELESFSYSVSHDLRSPLRAIIGFSAILQEEFGSQLDTEANRVITVIVDNAQMMSHLIDDLLKFSRLARLDAVNYSINVESIVHSCIKNLLLVEKGKIPDIVLNFLPACDGDESMLIQVWYNLIGNAIKYSSKNPKARIEIGSRESENKLIYYITDNGTGFDMKYYNKLFGVFQRLHNHDDYEGTGVGLALVKRIIEKHHGEVWAESIMDIETTFYFSIPKSSNGQEIR